MCLAIPGKILSMYDRQGIRMAKVDFGGVARESCLEYLEDVAIGDYVLVHVGFALSKIDPLEAARTFELLREMGELEELTPQDAPT